MPATASETLLSEPEKLRAAGLAVAVPTKPRVVVATAHTSDYAPLADLTVPTMRRYAERQGYDFYYEPAWETVIPNDGDRMKIRIYKDLYEAGQHDAFLWIDADAIVTNPEVEVGAWLEKRGIGDDVHFVWGCDIAGPNSGVYLARFTPECHAFLHASFNRGIEMGWGDNTAMINLGLVTPHKEIIRVVPGRYMNAYDYALYGWEKYNDLGDWRTAREAGDDWIQHWPGIPQERRIALISERIKEIYG